jgi:ABC-2 type transport system permease protein
MGKVLGLAAGIGLVLVPAAIVGSVAVTLQANHLDVARTIGLAAAYLLYFAVILAVSLVVSMMARSSRTALVVLLAGWVWTCLIAPRALTDGSRAFHPTPSSAEFEALVNGDSRGTGMNLAQVQALLLKEFNVTDPRDLPVNPRGVLQQRNEARSDEVWDRRFTALWDQFERQSETISWGGLVAPMTAVRAISMSFAGTDVAHHRDFAWAAERYRRTMVGMLNDDLAAHTDSNYAAGPELWSRIPEFRYSSPSAVWAFSQQKAPWVVLFLWIAMAAVGVVWCARRMSVV